jgi:hypothetical protein
MADMRTDIEAASERLGSVADAFVKMGDWAQETGGDDPENASDLVADLMSNDAADVNGCFH